MPLGGANPALFRHHNGYRVGTHQLQLTKGLGLLALHQWRTAIVTVFFRDCQQLFLDQGLEPGGTTQGFLQLIALQCQLILLTADVHFLQLGQVAQLQFQDGFGLHISNPKTLHQGRLGLVLRANNMDHFIDVKESSQVALEDMQPPEHALQPVFQAPAHRVGTKLQPLFENAVQSLDPGATINANHVQVDPVAALQVGCGEQMAHHTLEVHPIGAGHNDQPRGVFMVRFIAQIGHHGQFLGLHLLRYLLQHFGARHLVRQCIDHQIPTLLLPYCPHTQGTTAALIHGQNVFPGGDDFRICREIRRQYMFAELSQRGLGRLQQPDRSRDNLPQIMRGYISGHAHGNTRSTIEQYIGYLGR